MACREAAHAGSWYNDDAAELTQELDQWLQSSGVPKLPNARAVIAPHAGYRYSGRCAAYAFANIDPQRISRVFLLGPSHHHYTRKCALSTVSVYKTPIGDLPIDLEVYEELRATKKFEEMNLNVDEAEHSMEMHLPYLAKVFQGYDTLKGWQSEISNAFLSVIDKSRAEVEWHSSLSFDVIISLGNLCRTSVKIVPILVGSCTPETEAMYGRLLAKYLDDPKNFFSVSSDFCHWGSRFGYTYYEKKRGPIHKSIEALDQEGMNIIESGNPDAFQEYLKEFENTICGRHPIGVFLNMMKHCASQMRIKFVQYEQSSQCKSMRDSSVSYASAVVTTVE